MTSNPGTAPRLLSAIVPIEQAPAPPGGAPATGGGRAGRDVPVAIAVGIALAGLVAASLLVYQPAFAVVVALATSIGVWELVCALRVRDIRPPVVPLVAGAVAMTLAAYVAGFAGLLAALPIVVATSAVWRAASPVGSWRRDVLAAAAVTAYVPFLGGFALLLVTPSDGVRRVVVFVLLTACSDVGGFVTGVLLGRHRLAPSISPGKTWEGLAGSAVACLIAGVVVMTVLLPGAPWQGVVLGLAVTASATLGDLAESVIKRRTGIKDMGTLLPGHGGLMDRLDSLLPTAPVVWALLAVFVSAH